MRRIVAAFAAILVSFGLGGAVAPAATAKPAPAFKVCAENPRTHAPQCQSVPRFRERPVVIENPYEPRQVTSPRDRDRVQLPGSPYEPRPIR